MQPNEPTDYGGDSPDDNERIRDFWNRHGGPGSDNIRRGDSLPGVSGWSEVPAADGYTLRCDWSQTGSRRELQYTEKPPRR
jgi:hypothetical protein